MRTTSTSSALIVELWRKPLRLSKKEDAMIELTINAATRKYTVAGRERDSPSGVGTAVVMNVVR